MQIQEHVRQSSVETIPAINVLYNLLPHTLYSTFLLLLLKVKDQTFDLFNILNI